MADNTSDVPDRDPSRSSRPPRDGQRSTPHGGSRKPYAKRDGDRKPYEKRDGDRKPYEKRDGDRKPYEKRDGDRKPYAKRDGDRKPYDKHDGDRKPYAKRDGDRKPYEKRDGDRKPYAKRDGDRGPRPTRGGAGRPDRQMREGEIRPMRPRFDAPEIPEEITARDLHPAARNELKTLSKDNADGVARHLAMAARLIDSDPELAHQHALAASRRAGRIGVTHETLAITAYATGDFALALRELRTHRRITGREDHAALMVDSERGIGRPDKALETGRAVNRASLPTDARVQLAIAMSGAHLDQGNAAQALRELDIPELDPTRAFEWSPALFSARATVHEELGQSELADQWHHRAEVAADALDAAGGDQETIEVMSIETAAIDIVDVEAVARADEGTPVADDVERAD
ncbi:hypothetical protein [Microbacterium sp. C7(2022)]|uniref:hypothetical protein n=1 Tax=Microbacterium sp. C7(2022) TaxID=2992759 RepID=UPI00237B9325|nr:hypothetical protein [Microbacterium sp. C7(2022)]MDE0546661.1 hypothetical protein [Microbacterium sp. C7(2022)]